MEDFKFWLQEKYDDFTWWFSNVDKKYKIIGVFIIIAIIGGIVL